MITKYFKAATVRIPPVGHSAKLGRLFLANIPPKQRSQIDVKFQLLEPGCEDSELKVVFSNDQEVSVPLNTASSREMVEMFDRQSRQLQVQDSISM